jgi:hypothetical protein
VSTVRRTVEPTREDPQKVAKFYIDNFGATVKREIPALGQRLRLNGRDRLVDGDAIAKSRRLGSFGRGMILQFAGDCPRKPFQDALLLRHPGLAEAGEIGAFVQGTDLGHSVPCAREAFQASNT